MLIYPAIDLYDGKAVRLLKGDYNQMTIYGDNPSEISEDFKRSGAEYMHIVDLEGAKSGGTPNFDTVIKIKESFGGFCEVGGGIRNMETVERYLSSGIDRVIIGTAAITQEGFAESAVKRFGDKIAVGIDLKDGYAAIKGWTQVSSLTADVFFGQMQKTGVRTVICTDISKDGAMQGTNRALYKNLSEKFDIDIIASGGVSSMEDVKSLSEMNLYGAIIGKAYYSGAIDLKKAIEVAK